jgi:hypothetical protein
MARLKIVPIPTAVAETVRRTMKAPTYGFPAHRETAIGRAPCRHCLKLIRPHEEELILFTYDAFHGQGVWPSPGPVYIHADTCQAYGGEAQIPQEYRGQPLTFEAFGADRKRFGETAIREKDGDVALQELFADSAVEYVHARSTTAGCYLFRVERSTPGAEARNSA